MADDRLYELMKKNMRDGLFAASQGPEALRRTVEAMLPPEGPPEFVTSATDQERRDAFARVINELFPPETLDLDECTSEIEASYRKLVGAARRGPEAVRKTIEKLKPGTSDWKRTAWDILEARQKGRPQFLFKDPKSGGFLHWSPEE